MSEAWRSLKIKQFEQVAAGPVSLLRLSGKGARRREATPGERPTLVATEGDRVTPFPPLPSPPDERGVLRAAYSVPAALIGPQTRFSLRLADGHLIALPAPVTRPGAAPPAATGPPAPAPPAPAPADSDQVNDLRRQLADAHRRAEDALLQAVSASDQRDVLEQRANELEQTVRDRQAALDELEIWRGELERRLAAMSTELGETAARLQAAEQELETLRGRPDAPEGASGSEASEVALAGPEGEPGEPPLEPSSAGTPDAPLDLDELRRRAAAAAGEVAARELAEATGDAP